MEIREYQKLAKRTAFARDTDAYFLGLIGEVGSIFSAHKKTIRSSANISQIRAELDEQIGDAIWYLSAIASEYGVNLDAVLKNNLKKTANHFIGDRTKYFDTKFPAHERIPRRINARFTLIRGNKVRLIVNGVQLGNEVDDNSMRPDGYRFHDVLSRERLIKCQVS
jgi:NTP pyrophosphatase (non-canonical NTP hydrolase)